MGYGRTIKCSDYNIVKIIYYADRKLLNKCKGGSLPLQHHERARLNRTLMWDLIDKISGMNFEKWHRTYMYETFECALEYIQETTGTIIVPHEGYYTYFIPKDKQDILNWVLQNVKTPHKIVKKANIPWLSNDSKAIRNYSFKYTKEMNNTIYLKIRRIEKLKQLNDSIK